MFMGRHPEEGEDGPPRLLVDSWEEGADRHLLLVAQGGQGSVVTLVVHSPARHSWEGASVTVRVFPESYDRAALVAGIRREALGLPDLARLGLLGTRPTIADHLAGHMARPALSANDADMLRMGPGTGKTEVVAKMIERMERDGVRPAMLAVGGRDAGMREGVLAGRMQEVIREGIFRLDARPMGAVDRLQAIGRAYRLTPPRHLVPKDHGYEPETAHPVLRAENPSIVLKSLPAGDATPHTVLDLAGYSKRQTVETVEAAVRAQAPFLGGPEDTAAFAVLGPTHWTDRAHGYLSRGGRVGDRRRQAARLYPAFAVVLSTDRDACAAIDAGRPFEGALLENIRGMASPSAREGLTLAAMRRLRALPADTQFSDLAVAVEIAAQLPVDWLPKGALAWEAAIKAVRPLMAPILFAGLRLDDLSHHVSGDLRLLESSVTPPSAEADERAGARPREFGMGIAQGQPPHVAALHGARDMADRLADTLVSHACQSLGIIAAREETRRIAGAVLFAGKALPAVHRLQRDWHSGIPRLDAALPAHEAGNSWPALVPDFVARNGLVVTCLTDEAQLKAEGTRGPDADGIEGLHHCVGGYGRRCFGGETHVLSVRRPVGDGFERVSTVEIEVLPEREDNPDRLMVRQNYGRLNSEGSQPSYHAIMDMLAAVRGGDLALNPAACGRRSSEGFMDVYDWRVPGAMGQALAAWAEHLPRDVAAGGVEALRARVLEEARAIAATGGSVDLPGTLPAPDAEDAGPRPGF